MWRSRVELKAELEPITSFRLHTNHDFVISCAQDTTYLDRSHIAAHLAIDFQARFDWPLRERACADVVREEVAHRLLVTGVERLHVGFHDSTRRRVRRFNGFGCLRDCGYGD